MNIKYTEQFRCIRKHLDSNFCVEILEFDTGVLKVFLFNETPWSPRLCVINYMSHNTLDDKTIDKIVRKAEKCIGAYKELFDIIDIPYNTI